MRKNPFESRFDYHYKNMIGGVCLTALLGGADRLVHWGGLAVLAFGAILVALFIAALSRR